MSRISTDELREHRARFSRVKLADPSSLLAWFLETPHLSTADRAIIAGYSTDTVRAWRRLAGLTQPKGIKLQPAPKFRINTLVAPPDWDNPEWLAGKYGVYSIRDIAKATNTSYITIWRRIAKWGIVKDEQVHPCCNRQWLEKHYVKGLKTQAECAKLAGVSKSTIVNWLVNHSIAVRDRNKSQQVKRAGKASRVSIWTKDLVYKLSQHEAVRKVRSMERGCIVHYRSYVKEVYWYGERETKRKSYSLNRKNCRIINVPKVYEQYPAAFGDNPYPAHLCLLEKEWRKASLMEQRLAFHSLIIRLREQWWQRSTLPPEVVAKDWERLKSTDPGLYLKGNTFRAFANFGSVPAPGWAMVTHFFDLGDHMNPVWGKPSRLYKAAKAAFVSGVQPCTAEIIRAACRIWGPRVFSPALYVGILGKMRAGGPVLDLHPGLGHKAIACAILGLKYLVPPGDESKAFRDAAEFGLAALTGLDWAVDDGTSPVGLVISDDSFRGSRIEEAMAHADRARSMLAFVPAASRAEMQAKYRPDRVVAVKTKFHFKSIDYLFVW